MLSSVDRFILIVHDSASSSSFVLSKVSGKSGNSGDDYNYSELSSFFARSDASIDDRTSNCVEDGLLLVTSGSD